MKPRLFYKLNPATVKIGVNGLKFVDPKTVRDNELNFSWKNSKTGNVIAFNLPVELTCDHKCECYSKRNCYACGGCYMFSFNQALYSENLKYFNSHKTEEFIEKVVNTIKRHHSRVLFRWFTCGDIPNKRFVKAMVEIAKQCPEITFWTYTKKYMIVNQYVKENGLDSIPSNLTIVFSHWMNDDGTYFPMVNTYNFPTSEFIPMGKEELLASVNHVCPCSNPGIVEHCANCSTPCYKLKHGESMALVEHSTARTKDRDSKIKELRGKIKDFDLIAFLKSFVA